MVVIATQTDEVIGVDVGATKTHIAVAMIDRILVEEVIPTSSWRTGSTVASAGSLAAAVRRSVGPRLGSQGIGVGAHGCDSTAHCLQAQLELQRHFDGPVRVVNDAELLPLAVGARRGIGVVAGTGSIAVARNVSDELVTAGGWGWALGDEGSAAGIVREAARIVLDAMDRGRPRDALADRLLASLDASDGADVIVAMTANASADAWGRHVRSVFAAERDSEAARQVIRDGGAQLAGLVARLIARGIDADVVAVAGTVITQQTSLLDSFLATLRETHPELPVRLLDRPPVVGAIALAHRITTSPQRSQR